MADTKSVTIADVQTAIDDIKDRLPSASYLKLCNTLKLAYETSQPKYKYYKVSYVHVTARHKSHGHYKMDKRYATEIVRIKSTTLEPAIPCKLEKKLSCAETIVEGGSMQDENGESYVIIEGTVVLLSWEAIDVE